MKILYFCQFWAYEKVSSKKQENTVRIEISSGGKLRKS